ncbi:hypothetical protein [Streptomyces sp. NPDC101115]|uniref:hypothetical protein n=1 Tax=Streptomyces sp. NPDC101115 TaxID=3366106 RepID=UPI003825DF51
MGVKQRKRSRRWWVGITVGLFVCCGLPVSCVAWGAYSFSEAGRPQPVDCGEALAYGYAVLPVSARDATCTYAHWQDSYVEAEFRMPADEVAGWLEATYPAATVSEGGRRHHVGFAPASGKAHEVGVTVTDEGGGTAHVRFVAYDY